MLAVLFIVLLATGFRVLLYTSAPGAATRTNNDWQAALDREANLRRDLALLQEQWLGQQAQCLVMVTPPLKPESVTSPVPPLPPVAEAPVEPVSPSTPDEPPETPEPALLPADPPPAPIQPDTPLVIPHQPENMEFLKGCWRSVTDLFDTRDKKPIQHEYCFNQNGAGQVRVISESFICKGKINAVMQGKKKLVIKTLNQSLGCNNQTGFSGWQVICQAQANGKALCQGVNYNNKTRFSVTLLRK
ncbi:MAG: hypothetical protein WAW42_11605 [Candidatus Competibacteraceae bacterium]